MRHSPRGIDVYARRLYDIRDSPCHRHEHWRNGSLATPNIGIASNKHWCLQGYLLEPATSSKLNLIHYAFSRSCLPSTVQPLELSMLI